MKFNCDYCGKEGHMKKSQFERNKNHFCSKECKNNFQKRQITFNCDCCGKESSMVASQYKLKKNHFCSKECCFKWKEKQVTFICEHCGKESSRTKSSFKRRKQHFCSRECYERWHENQVVLNCEYCGKEYSITKSKFDNNEHHFCSMECRAKSDEKRVNINCDYCNKEINITQSMFDNNEHHFCSRECYFKWRSENLRGENNPSYKPNLTEEDREKRRNIQGYRDFVKGVFERDNYTCQKCGDNKGGNLVAHHLNGYHWCKDERVDVNNGITLCTTCHKLFHEIYSKKFNTKEQYEEWISE